MLLSAKRGVVFGASSKYSLGLHVAQAWCEAGASKIVIACETEALCEKVHGVASKSNWWSNDTCSVAKCDINIDRDIKAILQNAEFDMILHSVAMAPTSALRSGNLLQFGREEFLKTMETSSYSLLAIASQARFGANGGSLTALTFDATRRIVPGYGAMAPAKAALETLSLYLSRELGGRNVRVNCISPGPINTPAARVIPNFHALCESAKTRSALKRGVTPSEVASMAVFLASDMASGITGQILHIDCGEATGIV